MVIEITVTTTILVKFIILATTNIFIITIRIINYFRGPL